MKSSQSLLIFVHFEWVLLLFIYYCSKHEIYSSDKTLSFAGTATSSLQLKWSDVRRLFTITLLIYTVQKNPFKKSILSGEKKACCSNDAFRLDPLETLKR